jgi:rhamnulokinase
MTMTRHLAAADLGAESGRVILGRFDGDRISIEELHRFPNRQEIIDGTLHWRAEELFDEIVQGIARAVDVSGGQLDGIGVDTWGVDYGLIDASGALVAPPVAYRDSRTDGVMEEVHAQLSPERVYAETGIQFMPINTLYQLVAERRAEPSLLDRADRVLFIPDLLNYWLSGRATCEYTIASTSQCLNMADGKWAPLMEDLGLSASQFAELIQPGTVLGPLTDAVREKTGAGAVPVIAVGGHDTASAVAAVPFETEDAAYLSSGTWSLLGIECPEPIINDASQALSMTNEGGVLGTIRLLKNIAGLWLIQECRRTWEEEGHRYDYAELTRMAEEAPPFAAVIEADDPRFASPGHMPNRIRTHCDESGQPVPDSHASVIRTALEGLAIKYRMTLDSIESLSGKPIRRLHIVGGGTQNKLLNQMTADAIDREVVAGPIEATALGNMVMQLVALGDLADLEAARRVIKASFPLETYQPRQAVEWVPLLEQYRNLFAN